MSGAPTRLRSTVDESESEVRPVLGPAGNKTRSLAAFTHQKPLSKASFKSKNQQKVEDKTPEPLTPPEEEERKKTPSSPLRVPSILRCQDQLSLRSNLSLNASCSSDVSTDSLQSRASTGRFTRSRSVVTASSVPRRRKQCVPKSDKSVSDSDSVSSIDTSSQSQGKRRCAWVTSNTVPCYAAFHDEEWGVPVHDDKKLFEMLVYSGALAELTWPTILMKRHIFREVFADLDPITVSKMNEKKIIAPGSPASSLLSESKLRAIIENARQITKIIEVFGSFDKYIWSFVNYKPIANKFRYPRQVPAKTSKADVISKDLLKRGFRSVSATVIYSFMQVAGLTNDHLVSCFRHHECTNPVEQSTEDSEKLKAEEKSKDPVEEVGLARAMDELSFPSE